MEYEIRELSWFKRRTPVREPKPICVSVRNDLELVDNSYCFMAVGYDDGHVFEFNARVSQNPLNKKWTVHGMDGSTGRQCLVDVIE
jgi:hypothetical protein